MKAYKSYLDNISIGISALCVVHCVILPIFLTTLPLWDIEILENSYIESFTTLSTLIAGSWAIGRGYKKYHRHLAVPVLFVLGITMLLVSNFTNGELLEKALKGCGAVFIISAHITNWKKCNACCTL